MTTSTFFLVTLDESQRTFIHVLINFFGKNAREILITKIQDCNQVFITTYSTLFNFVKLTHCPLMHMSSTSSWKLISGSHPSTVFAFVASPSSCSTSVGR